MTTKQLEIIAYQNLWKQGTYLCFEVMMPRPDGKHYMDNLERVDLLSYDTKGIWRFYELKVSKSDFHSGCKHTFLGNFNYFIMPHSLYLEVMDEIPKGIGVYTSFENTTQLSCVKKATRQELRVNENHLMFNFMQALSREYKKYRQTLRFGKWYESAYYDKTQFACNICFNTINLKKIGDKLPKFCEHCGARMTGKLKDDETVWHSKSTEYENILRMNVDELAEFLRGTWDNNVSIFPDCCTETTHCYGDCTDTPNCIKQWLESEV